jgi:hypothetical protein
MPARFHARDTGWVSEVITGGEVETTRSAAAGGTSSWMERNGDGQRTRFRFVGRAHHPAELGKVILVAGAAGPIVPWAFLAALHIESGKKGHGVTLACVGAIEYCATLLSGWESTAKVYIVRLPSEAGEWTIVEWSRNGAGRAPGASTTAPGKARLGWSRQHHEYRGVVSPLTGWCLLENGRCHGEGSSHSRLNEH